MKKRKVQKPKNLQIYVGLFQALDIEGDGTDLDIVMEYPVDGGSISPKEGRRLSAWLLRAADWMERK